MLRYSNVFVYWFGLFSYNFDVLLITAITQVNSSPYTVLKNCSVHNFPLLLYFNSIIFLKCNKIFVDESKTPKTYSKVNKPFEIHIVTNKSWCGTEAELFARCSLLVTFRLLLVTFCSLLVIFCSLLVIFSSKLL